MLYSHVQTGFLTPTFAHQNNKVDETVECGRIELFGASLALCHILWFIIFFFFSFDLNILFLSLSENESI